MLRLFCATFLMLLVSASLHISAQTPRVWPGTRPDVFATIGGSAVDSIDRPLPNALMRLRDARLGRIADSRRTDRDGLFTFDQVEPGSYIVEIIAENGAAVLAASQVLHVEAGQAASVVVRLPFDTPKVVGGPTSTIRAIVAESALAGILLINLAGTATCDTLQ